MAEEYKTQEQWAEEMRQPLGTPIAEVSAGSRDYGPGPSASTTAAAGFGPMVLPPAIRDFANF